MDAYPSTPSDSLSTLCERLRSERLLVNSEQETLQQLNSTVDTQLAELNQLTWVSQQEKLVLRRLVNSDPLVRPENCCQLVATINAARFKEGYRGVGHHAASISQVFRLLLSSPRAVAEFLSAADQLPPKEDPDAHTTDELCRSVFNMLYGSCSFPGDERSLLDVLANLITLQLVPSPEPRKLLRKGNTAFSRVYHLFTEQLFSAKVFLTAALHEPIMFLLSQDELFLDTDPSKSPIRFPVEERRRRFGVDENSKVYKDRVAIHRKAIVEKLVTIGNQFLKAIQAAIPCFPSSIIWLVRQLHTSLIERKRITKEEAALICTDLIFTYFLCPAITNPEPLGVISDTPISYIARFNLMQVGQILQTLALLPYEQPPTYFMSLLSRFDQECMPRIVGRILSSDSVSIETMFPNIVAGPNGSELYARKACVGSLQEVNVLHSYLRSSAVDQMSDSAIAKELKNTMRRMPDEFTTTENSHQEGPISPGAGESLLRSRPSSSARLRNLAGRVQTAASKGQQRFLQNSPSRAKSPHDDNSPNQRSSESNAVNADDAIGEVYIFSLMDDSTPLGLEPEEKIMQSFRSTRKHRSSENATEKKTRFMTTESVISDRTSTEAASDDEEEGAGSVSSSLNDNVDEVDEEDVEVDNFSDVVPISANVSGRGSPSLSGERMSGRDTPFSANAADQNDTATVSSTIAGAANLATDAKRNLPSLPVTVRKQNPEGLEEKFGKFGLPPTDPSRYRDETYSLVSDSWSTDVVASDNEGLGESRQDAAQQLFAQNAPPALAAGLAAVFPGLVPHNALAPAVQLPADPNAPPDPPQLQQRLAVGGVQRHPRNPSGVPEDRSDTWSLDATASDSEADAVANAANTEQDLLVLDDLPNLPEGQASSGNPGGASRRTPTTASYSVTSAGPAPMLRRKSSQPSAELESLPEADIPGPSGISLPVISSAFSNVNELTSRDRIRRQSSGGSSFYSRSDVDSEFSKDNEEPLINFAAEALQRTASGDVPVEPINFVSDPISPAKKAATFTTSCTLPLQSVSSSTTSSAAVTPKGSQTRNGCYPIPRGSSDDLDTIPPVPTSSAACAQRDTLAKSKSFAPTETPSPERSTPLAGTNSSGRRLNLIHQGLQRVGATLKRNKGVVSFGQSMTHSATVDDLASISVAFARNGATGLRNSGRARLAESHSVGHIVDVSEENGEASSMTVNAAERQRVADDILNKYRAMPSPISASAANSFAGILLDARPLDAGSAVQPLVNTDQPYYDPANIVQCKAFADAKRKLRLVLSSAANVPTNGTARATGMSISGIIIDAGGANKNNAVETNQDTHGLTEFLKLLLAESINSQDKTLSAQIREVQRCLAIFDAKGIRKLLRTLKEDHRRRTSYVLYLQHSRITLLQLNSYLGKLGNRIKREKALTNECLIEVLVRFYLEKNEQFLRRFIHDFQMLKANDEKTDAVDRALRFLCERMLIEPMWRSSTQDSLDYARKSLERSLMAQIYVFALYPNGDADQSRDEVFFKSMQRLAAAITPDHPELRIPKQYHGECPWPSAQAEIAIINAYKSPRDKMACVVRCCETIENLIILASERGTASADDITPILVFVLLQANPPGLFSNIQYINGFYAARMEGGESYWWTQFTSAVEFIKQMLNKS